MPTSKPIKATSAARKDDSLAREAQHAKAIQRRMRRQAYRRLFGAVPPEERKS
jgi:hypothetical protein